MQNSSSMPSSGDAIRQAVLHGSDTPVSPAPNAPQVTEDANKVDLDAQQVKLDAEQVKLNTEQATPNMTQIIQEANQVELDAAQVDLDAKQVALDTNQGGQTNPTPTMFPVVPSSPDGQVTSLVMTLANRLPAQVQLFQDARQQIQILQAQTTAAPVIQPVTPVLLSVDTPPTHISTDVNNALILFQQSMQQVQQALNAASAVLDSYTTLQVQSVLHNTVPSSTASLQVQAKLAEQYSKEGLALGNLASELAFTPQASTAVSGASPLTANPADIGSDILNFFNQGLTVVQTIGPVLEIIAALI